MHSKLLHCFAFQHGTAQHSTARHCTALHGTAQHNIAVHDIARYDIAWRDTERCSVSQHDTAQHGLPCHSLVQVRLSMLGQPLNTNPAALAPAAYLPPLHTAWSTRPKQPADAVHHQVVPSVHKLLTPGHCHKAPVRVFQQHHLVDNPADRQHRLSR